MPTAELPAPRDGLDALPSSATEASAGHLWEHAPCGFLSTAADGTVLRVNATLLRWLQQEPDAVVGRRFQDLMTAGSRVLWQTLNQRALLETGRTTSGTSDLLTRTGARLPVLVSGELVRAEGAAPVVRLIVLDATERRAHEARLVTARDEAERAQRRLTVLQAVTQACVSAADPAVLLQEVAARVAEGLLAEGTAVWLDEDGRLVRGAVVDLDDDLAPPVLEAAAAAHLLTAALQDGPRRLGVLGLLLPEHAVDAEHAEQLLRTVAAQLAQALVRLRVDAERSQRQAFTDALLHGVDVGIVACDAHGRLTSLNRTASAWHGRPVEVGLDPEQLAERYDLFDADGTTRLAAEHTPLLRALRGEAVVAQEIVIRAPGRDPVRVLCSGQRLTDGAGGVVGAVVAMHDVTVLRARERALRESAAFHDAVLVASPDLVYTADPVDGAVQWASRPHSGAEVGVEQAHADDVVRVRAADLAARGLPDGGVVQVRYRVPDGDGGWRWLARRATPFARDADGEVTQVLATARDVTDVVEVEQRLKAAALHDPLTGLPNRSLLAERLRESLAQVEPQGRQVAVLFVDLDGFKHVNDSAGHAAGDAVLRAVAERLRACVRPQDCVARVGGDEFVVVLDPRTDRGTGPELLPVEADALAVAARIGASLARPVAFDGLHHEVTASVGISLAGADQAADDVLRDADSAMYRAKRAGKDRAEVFRPVLRSEAVERTRVERELREALRGQPGGSVLSVAYQPVLDLATGRVVAVEALARLTAPDGTATPPDEFIPVAEDCGLVGLLGQQVLSTACADLAVWRRSASPDLGLAVNVSAHQARLPDLGDQVRSALADWGLDPALLTLELTESALLSADAATSGALHDLRDLGVRISIDDFGTGWASLRYLTELPVTGVKVDRSFTAGLPGDDTRSTIVRLVATLAAELGLTCVVEGIETRAQLGALPRGVQAQGFLLGRPRPAADLSVLLAAC